MSQSLSLIARRMRSGGLSAGGAVVLHAAILMSFLAASSAPTPLYRLYQREWQFTSTVLTAIFAAYALALLLSLLVAGRLSDHLGRRPVIALALGLQGAAMCGFLLASGPWWLIGSRIVQGLATGLATAAVGAALLDLGRERGALINSIAPMVGMAVGVLGSTALVVFLPAPLHTVYGLLLTLFLLAFGALWLMPETAQRRSGAVASLRFKVTVPVQVRGPLLRVTPVNMAVWMLGGFYLSLMPSLISSTMHIATLWLGGMVVAALTLTGAVAVLTGRYLETARTLRIGEWGLGLGVLVILSGANLGNAGLLLVGSVVAGFGFGAAFSGAVRTVLPLAEPHERAALMGAFYVESYLAHSVPTMAIGYVAQAAGLSIAANVYGGLILALVLLSAGWSPRVAARGSMGRMG
ncbi:hypothetical protein CDEF62S_04653 [Castellaniella defragrans]